MSLILEALKKVEREKQAAERGLVVVGSLPWQGLRPARRVPALLGSVLLVAAAAAAVWWWLAGADGPRPPREHGQAAVGERTTTTMAMARPRAPVAAAAPAPLAASAATLPGPRQDRLSAPPSPRRLAVPGAASSSASPDQGAGAGAVAEPAAEPLAARRSPTADALQLTAISERDGKPVALIDGRLVHEGDSFGDVKVLRIGEDEVEVEVRGRHRVLRF